MKKRKTIGFFIEYIDSEYHYNILKGVLDSAERHYVNLICYEGGVINNQNNFENVRNIVYDFADTNKLDGIIMLGDSVTLLLDDEKFDAFCNKYAPLPIMSIGRSSKSLSSINIDSFNGMKSLMKHLIKKHNYKNFAFIKGIEGSKETIKRFKIFEETLKEHSIPINPDLIYNGNYEHESGADAVKTWLDIVKEKIDVIVASNDNMALGAMEELLKRDIKVPEELAVVGFDDLNQCSSVIPTLTTVRQPLHKIGWKSVEILLDLIESSDFKNKIFYIESTLIIRESCGCNRLKNELLSKYFGNDKNYLPLMKIKEELKNNIYKKILDAVQAIYYDTTKIKEREVTDKLIEYLIEAAVKKDQMIFYNFWLFFLDLMMNLNQEIVILKKIIDILFKSTIELCDKKNTLFFNNLCISIQNATYSNIIIIEKNINYNLIKESFILNNLRDDISINLKMNDIYEVLSSKLKQFGIKSSFLSLYKDENKNINETAQLVMAYENFKDIEIPSSGIFFPIKNLIPKNFFPEKERYSMIAEYLNYSIEPIGIILFDINSKTSTIFSSLRRLINNILRMSILYSRLEQQRNNLTINISKLRMIMAGIIETLSVTVEIRDPYTAGHQRRVSDLARTIASKMQLPSNIIEGIRMSGIVHDLGKIYVPSEILNKPGRLLDIEFELIKHHPKAGYEILKNVDFPWPIAEIVYQHHEKLDGSGYPRGLKSDEILLESKIISVADVVEAITSMRPYRPALGIDVAIDEIKKYSGKYFDPDAVKACIAVFEEDGYEFKS